MLNLIQVASLASLAQLLPPRSPTVSNPAPDSSLCRAAAPRLRPLAPRLHPLQLLLAACVRFESAAAPGPDCIRFNCCSPFASASSCCSPIAPASAAAACMLTACVCFSCCFRSRPLRLLLPDCVRFGCCSPNCVRFDCCSPIACIRLQSNFSNILRGVRGSVEGCASL